MRVDALGANLPGGEFFGCPLEDSAEGEISFGDSPLSTAAGRSRESASVRGRPRRRCIRRSNEAYLIEMLDTDEGARRLGELGIGCNPGITRYMKNTLFDEKMDGTVHLALGNSYTDLGGVNESAIHWDLVKDLRPGWRIELDGVVVQRTACGASEPARASEVISRSAAGGGGRPGGGQILQHVAPQVLEHPAHRPERAEPPKSSAPAANTRAPAGVS